jgi:hypothetical protein
MNFKNLIYSAIIAVSLNLITFAGRPLSVNEWEVPDHLTDKAREILYIDQFVDEYTIDQEEFEELIRKLMIYDAHRNGLRTTTKEQWLKLKLKLKNEL